METDTGSGAMDPRRQRAAKAVIAAAAMGIAIASSSTGVGAANSTYEHRVAIGQQRTWGVDDVRAVLEWAKRIEEPTITVLVAGVRDVTAHEIATKWLIDTASSTAQPQFEVKSFLAAVPVVEKAYLATDPTRDTTPQQWKDLWFEPFSGPAIKGVKTQLQAMAQAGGMEINVMGRVDAQYAALPLISKAKAQALHDTRFEVTQVPALVHVEKDELGDDRLMLERVVMRKGVEGKLYVGMHEADLAKARALLVAAGWGEAMIECTIEQENASSCTEPMPVLDHGVVVAAGGQRETFADWYARTHPAKEESLLEMLFAPRIP